LLTAGAPASGRSHQIVLGRIGRTLDLEREERPG
jgi:hypothetical protein